MSLSWCLFLEDPCGIKERRILKGPDSLRYLKEKANSTVTLAVGKYLVPYRTQKSSRQTPTIVNAKIGSCRTEKKPFCREICRKASFFARQLDNANFLLQSADLVNEYVFLQENRGHHGELSSKENGIESVQPLKHQVHSPSFLPDHLNRPK